MLHWAGIAGPHVWVDELADNMPCTAVSSLGMIMPVTVYCGCCCQALTSKQMMLVLLVWALAILMAFSTTSEPLLAKRWQSRPLGAILVSLSNSPTCRAAANGFHACSAGRLQPQRHCWPSKLKLLGTMCSSPTRRLANINFDAALAMGFSKVTSGTQSMSIQDFVNS